MNVTVVRSTNTVTVDGESYRVDDCRMLASYIKVIHWYGDSERGSVEFVQDPSGRFMPNIEIKDFAPYSFLLDKFYEAKGIHDRQVEADKQALAEAHEASAALQQH